jgi:hypothetical protein
LWKLSFKIRGDYAAIEISQYNIAILEFVTI